MIERFSELRCKEIINVCDGARMGYIWDLEIETCSGDIRAILVPGRGSFFGRFCCKDDYLIPWECITKIGEDLILVEINPEKARIPREKRWKF